jgi:hypothetical protein
MDKYEVVERWCQDVLPLVWNGQPPPDDESALLGGGFALLSADTDRTQSYVFQSSRLPEIRGASMQLDTLNHKGIRELLEDTYHLITNDIIPDETKNKPRGCVIYAGGGSLLAIVPPQIADDIVKDIEKLYPEQTGSATITAVSSPVPLNILRGT